MNPTAALQKLAIHIVRLIPLRVADRIAIGIALVFCRFSRRRREQILTNLRHIFAGEHIGRHLMGQYLKNTFTNYARAMVDFLRLSYITKDDFSVDVEGRENIDDALKHGRGCIMLTMHIGNWDYAGCYLAAHGVPMSALAEEIDPEMYELYKRHRERTGMVTFPLSKAGYGFLHTIRNNRVLAVLGDRDITKKGVTVEFFDGKRNIPQGLGQIVIKRRIPVVFGYMIFNPLRKGSRYLGWISAPEIFAGNEDEFNAVMVKKFEQFIHRFPDQWMLFQNDWVS
jgi:lauroyl/myristoyl acyltransferase